MKNQNNTSVFAIRDMSNGFVFSIIEETCSCCDKNKIISGLFVQIGTNGVPCCENCYKTADQFSAWFEICTKMQTKIPKQFDWFLYMFFNGYTPEAAIDDMLMVV